MKLDLSFLQAALVGYETKLAEIETAMADLRRRIHAPEESAQPDQPRKRALSSAARQSIAAAQKRRWAAYHKAQKAAKK